VISLAATLTISLGDDSLGNMNIPFGDNEFLSNATDALASSTVRLRHRGPPKTGCLYPDDRRCTPSLGVRATGIPVFPCDPYLHTSAYPAFSISWISWRILRRAVTGKKGFRPSACKTSVRDDRVDLSGDLRQADGCCLQISDTDFTTTRLCGRPMWVGEL